MSAITDRILNQLGDDQLLRKLSELPGSDLNSLLLALFQAKAHGVDPAGLPRAFAANKYAAPSGIDPVLYHEQETALLSLARQEGIAGVLLSPVAPLGSSAAFGCVDQNLVMSASRGSEVLSDPTNMLAILIADGLKSNALSNREPLHFCATARVIRTAPLPGPRMFAHFGLFAMVSYGRDSGSYACEKQLLVKHIAYYKTLFLARYRANLSVVLRKRGGYTDTDGFFDRMAALMRDELPDVPISFDHDHTDNAYYKGINFKLYIEKDQELIEVGDGGFVDWIARMTGDKRERCLISAIGIERLMAL